MDTLEQSQFTPDQCAAWLSKKTGIPVAPTEQGFQQAFPPGWTVGHVTPVAGGITVYAVRSAPNCTTMETQVCRKTRDEAFGHAAIRMWECEKAAKMLPGNG